MGDNPAKRICLDPSSKNDDLIATTGVADAFSFLWIINDFSKQKCSNQPIKSPDFEGGPKGKHQWQLDLLTEHEFQTPENEYFSIILSLKKTGNVLNSVKAGYRISILDESGNPAASVSGNGFYDFDTTYRRRVRAKPSLISKEDLYSPKRKLLVNDILNIRCEIWFVPEPKTVNITRGVAASKEEKCKKLSNDCGKMFRESLWTDVTLSTGTATFKAHKSILAARSPVFAARFNEESKLHTLEIPGFDADVLKAALEYIYTGETDLLVEHAPELLRIAEKYGLGGLKDDCELIIAERITIQNAIPVLILARSENSQVVKSRAVTFIKENFESVKNTTEYKDVKERADPLFVDLVD